MRKLGYDESRTAAVERCGTNVMETRQRYFRGSTASSSSIVSFIPRLNSLALRPRLRIKLGNFAPPKRSKTMNKKIIISTPPGIPIANKPATVIAFMIQGSRKQMGFTDPSVVRRKRAVDLHLGKDTARTGAVGATRNCSHFILLIFASLSKHSMAKLHVTTNGRMFRVPE